MRLREITEGAVTTFARQGNKTVRKYKCTSGDRKGRIVAKAATCSAPKSVKKSASMAKTKQSKGSTMSAKSQRTKQVNPGSRRSARLNRNRKKSRSRSKKI